MLFPFTKDKIEADSASPLPHIVAFRSAKARYFCGAKGDFHSGQFLTLLSHDEVSLELAARLVKTFREPASGKGRILTTLQPPLPFCNTVLPSQTAEPLASACPSVYT
jgi:hypothetical protein